MLSSIVGSIGSFYGIDRYTEERINISNIIEIDHAGTEQVTETFDPVLQGNPLVSKNGAEFIDGQVPEVGRDDNYFLEMDAFNIRIPIQTDQYPHRYSEGLRHVKWMLTFKPNPMRLLITASYVAIAISALAIVYFNR